MGCSPYQIPGYPQLWEREEVNISSAEGDLGVPEPPGAAEELMPILASPKSPGMEWGKVLSRHIPGFWHSRDTPHPCKGTWGTSGAGAGEGRGVD